jgi:hypothetical protein
MDKGTLFFCRGTGEGVEKGTLFFSGGARRRGHSSSARRGGEGDTLFCGGAGEGDTLLLPGHGRRGEKGTLFFCEKGWRRGHSSFPEEREGHGRRGHSSSGEMGAKGTEVSFRGTLKTEGNRLAAGHGFQEVRIALGLAQFFEQQFHGLGD